MENIRLPGAHVPDGYSWSDFKPLALDEGYPDPDGARTDVSNAPTKKNLTAAVKEAPCDEPDQKMSIDNSYANRKEN